MLHSFRKHNPWFKGDIVLIHDGLSEPAPGRLERVSDELSSRVDAVIGARPDFAAKRARFYSLDAFRLRGYDKVLFCDSDLLFRHSIQDLFELPYSLVACGDDASYRGAGHDYVGLGKLTNTFNAGLMLMDRTLLTDAVWTGLLRLVTPAVFRHTHFTDQAVLNLYFAGRQHLADRTYNHLLGLTPMVDARVLHFNGPQKPWLSGDCEATALWRAEYAECQ